MQSTISSTTHPPRTATNPWQKYYHHISILLPSQWKWRRSPFCWPENLFVTKKEKHKFLQFSHVETPLDHLSSQHNWQQPPPTKAVKLLEDISPAKNHIYEIWLESESFLCETFYDKMLYRIERLKIISASSVKHHRIQKHTCAELVQHQSRPPPYHCHFKG